MAPSEDWFERVWEDREDTLYPRIFGTASEGGIYVLRHELFRDRFHQEEVDPRWLHHGVLVFPPAGGSSSWRYVTSGLSNDWEGDHPDPSGPSGLGIELVLETPRQAQWAVNVTTSMLAYQLLLAAGRYGEPRLLGPYARIPLNGAIDGAGSQLTHLLVCPSSAAPEPLELESGTFSLVQLVGVTEAEVQFARDRGGEELLQLLTARGAWPATDASRASVV